MRKIQFKCNCIEKHTVMTVRQYGYAFHASSCISNEPFGANRRMNAGTLDAKWYIL